MSVLKSLKAFTHFLLTLIVAEVFLKLKTVGHLPPIKKYMYLIFPHNQPPSVFHCFVMKKKKKQEVGGIW
jgi:hypothetical protein